MRRLNSGFGTGPHRNHAIALPERPIVIHHPIEAQVADSEDTVHDPASGCVAGRQPVPVSASLQELFPQVEINVNLSRAPFRHATSALRA